MDRLREIDTPQGMQLCQTVILPLQNGSILKGKKFLNKLTNFSQHFIPIAFVKNW